MSKVVFRSYFGTSCAFSAFGAILILFSKTTIHLQTQFLLCPR